MTKPTDLATTDGVDRLWAATDGRPVDALLANAGWKNKLQSAIANVTPAGLLAEQHRRMAEPGSRQKVKP